MKTISQKSPYLISDKLSNLQVTKWLISKNSLHGHYKKIFMFPKVSANIMHPVLAVLNIMSCPQRINSKKEKTNIRGCNGGSISTGLSFLFKSKNILVIWSFFLKPLYNIHLKISTSWNLHTGGQSDLLMSII